MQAIDRAHKLGKNNPVTVYRMITENTVEEKLFDHQLVKFKWDNLGILSEEEKQSNKVISLEELKDLLKFDENEV